MPELELRIQIQREQASRQKERKLRNYRQQNLYIRKGQVLFTGSSLMEQFPITEYCVNENLPTVYNRGIGGYTTDEFLDAIDVVLLDLEPSKLFLNIGTNDIRPMSGSEDWFAHLFRNYHRICRIIKERLPETTVYLMAYYPVNSHHPLANDNPLIQVRTNENIAKANQMVETLAESFGFRYIDVGDGLKDTDGNLRIEHTFDGIHFDAAAYRTVFDRLKKHLEAT